MTGRIPEPGELAEDIAELKAMLFRIGERLDTLPYVRSDLYEANDRALRTEVARELAAIRETSSSARALAMWALGLICTAVIGAVFMFVATAGGSG